MKNFLKIFIPIVLLNCCQNNLSKKIFFDDNRMNAWEIATIDSINHLHSNLYEIYKNKDDYYANLLGEKINRIYNHWGRRLLSEYLRNDSSFRSTHFKEILLIEIFYPESHSSLFHVLCSTNSEVRILTYVNNKGTVELKNNNKTSIEELKNLIKFLNYNSLIDTTKFGTGSDYVITRFVENKIIIYPFITGNFRGYIFDKYKKLFSEFPPS